MTNLLGTSFKIEKSNTSASEYLSTIQYLSPATESIAFGGFNTCSFATKCAEVCLGKTAGMMTFSTSKQARINRTLLLKNDRQAYGAQLSKEIEAHIRRANKKGLTPAIRLNGDSDLRWENMKFGGQTMIERYPNIVWYDYTKWPTTKRPTIAGYHLTFSRSEKTTFVEIQESLDLGRNVAVVFDSVPDTWEGLTVINGDTDDMRFNDPVGVIVGLKAKGAAIKDTTGFVVRLVTKVVNGKIVQL